MAKQYTFSTKPIIICDKRESKIIDYIRSFNSNNKVKIIEEQLEVGDFIVDEIVIERKSFNDFISSIIDGRLFRQLEELSKADKSILIIEGPFTIKRKFSVNAYIGALAYILAKYKTSVVFTFSPLETAKLLLSIATKLRNKKDISSRIKVMKKTGIEKEKLVISILSSFPGISEKTAKKIINHFGTIQKFITAKPSEIKKIVGEKKAKRIIEILNYKTNKEL